MQVSFKQKVILHDIVDAKPYQLDVNLNGDKRTIQFYYAFLNDKQIEVVNRIIKLKELKFKKIKYHKFPQQLLTERLPKPSPEPVIK